MIKNKTPDIKVLFCLFYLHLLLESFFSWSAVNLFWAASCTARPLCSTARPLPASHTDLNRAPQKAWTLQQLVSYGVQQRLQSPLCLHTAPSWGHQNQNSSTSQWSRAAVRAEEQRYARELSGRSGGLSSVFPCHRVEDALFLPAAVQLSARRRDFPVYIWA